MEINDKNNTTSPQSKNTVLALWHLQKIILDSLDFKQVVQRIVDGLLTELGYLNLGYRIIVLTLVNYQYNVLERISLSQTKEAERALAASAVPFHDIKIPLDSEENLLIKTLKQKSPNSTHDWSNIFTPILTPEEAARNQKAAGIKTSMTFPVIVKEKSIGVLIFSMVKDEKEVTDDERDLIRGFTDVVGLAVQNSQLYTSLAETTKKLQRANERLKQLDQLKDDFVSVASHELRTPMAAIKSYLWMALAGRGGALSDKQKYYLDRAYNSTDRLIKLVNDMLNISRIESGRMTYQMGKVDIEKLAEDVLAEVKPRADELGLHVTIVQPREPMPEVLADTDKIKEVLINLIGNSLKFTPAGGHINISFVRNNDEIITSVRDDGRGIKPENLPRLFTKFGLITGSYIANQATQGTGLGLYISKSIIEYHRGKIWGQSEGRDKGAIFSFSLKIYSEEQASRFVKVKPQENAVGMIHNAI